MKHLLGLFGFLFAASLAAQSPLIDKSKQELCEISGVVVKAGDGTPLRKATVYLYGMEPGSSPRYGGTTDDGRFMLDKVEPGQYRLSVVRRGYVSQEYGQLRPEQPGAVLSLSAGQKMLDLIFKLIATAVISGRVQDEDGEPMPSVHITALERKYYNGKRNLESQGETSTNDLGEYRLFNLAPGHYFISAHYEPGSHFVPGRRAFAGVEALNPGYVTTYYPNASDLNKAVAVNVNSADEIRSVDLMLSPTHVVKVRGHVRNAITGKSAINTSVQLLPKDSESMNSELFQSSAGGDDGSFEISTVTPGSYIAQASWFSENKIFTGRQPVEVGSADVDGVLVTIAAGLEISGHLVWEGKPEIIAQPQSVVLNSVDLQQFVFGRALVKPDGSFVLSNIGEGLSRVRVSGLGNNSFLKAVHYANTDNSVRELTVTRGVESPLELILSSNGARVEGRVTTSESLPAAGVWVVLIPGAPNRNRGWLYKSTNTDQNGRFGLRGVPPGEYQLFSWDRGEEGAWEDPEFLKPFEDQGLGEPIRVQEGDAKSVNLTTIKTVGTEEQKP